MAGKNISLLDIPPGVHRNSTRYAAGKRWYDANQMRWENNVLVPVGGWVKKLTFTGATTSIRRMHTWRDLLSEPWLAAGASDKLFGVSYIDGYYTQYDITPVALGWNPGGLTGFGRDFFGSGDFGFDGTASAAVLVGTWSMDNFGKLLTAVHSQDGRLVSWDPVTPSTVAAVVAGAPTDNLLVIASDEEHLFLLGGASNPRKVKWCSRREINNWTAAEDNSAGGFDLQTNGSIRSCCRVQGGILVLTDADAHIIEYVGPPNYYSRRRISDECGTIGKYCISPLQGGAVWLDHNNVWMYNGGAITKLPCSVQTELFNNSNFSVSEDVHTGINEKAQEIWFFYPGKGKETPNRYVALSYSQEPYWTLGELPRSSWINPVWQNRPLACLGNSLYEHENGMLADGVSRANEIYAETGALEAEEGDHNTWIDRIYPDFGTDTPGEVADPDAIRMSFYLQQYPQSPERLVGPLSLTNPKGYVTTRFRARQMYVRITQVKDTYWRLGKVRFRAKQGAKR